MRCREFEEQLPDYLHQSLDPEQQRAVEAHLERCGDCREQVALWKKLSLLPEEKPTAGLRARFEAMLAAYQQGQEAKQSRNTWAAPWKRRAKGGYLAPLAQAALVIVLVGLGFAGGRYVSGLNTNNRELTSLHQELAGMRQLVVLSLLQQQSASERLRAVTWSVRANQADPEILSALTHTLRFDPSADVRLASLDALKHFSGQPRVRSELLDALRGQQSPLVQIALIDLFVELGETTVLQRLKEFEQEQDLNPVVRQRAQAGIAQLTRG
jgi:anti-sigma factor RsiW